MVKITRKEFYKLAKLELREVVDGQTSTVEAPKEYLDYLFDWHISQLQSVFEEIEKMRKPLTENWRESGELQFNEAIDKVLSIIKKIK